MVCKVNNVHVKLEKVLSRHQFGTNFATLGSLTIDMSHFVGIPLSCFADFLLFVCCCFLFYFINIYGYDNYIICIANHWFLHTSPIETMLKTCYIKPYSHSFESAWKARTSWHRFLLQNDVMRRNVVFTSEKTLYIHVNVCDIVKLLARLLQCNGGKLEEAEDFNCVFIDYCV